MHDPENPTFSIIVEPTSTGGRLAWLIICNKCHRQLTLLLRCHPNIPIISFKIALGQSTHHHAQYQNDINHHNHLSHPHHPDHPDHPDHLDHLDNDHPDHQPGDCSASQQASLSPRARPSSEEFLLTSAILFFIIYVYHYKSFR